MAVYVLVHGGWSGAHGFHRVRPLLREQGHDVFTPCLTGIGARVHLASPSVFVPRDGESVFSMMGASGDGRIGLGDAWLVPPVPRTSDDPAFAAFADARRTPHPIRCFTEPVHLSRPIEQFPFGRTYVRATADAPDAAGSAVFDAAAEHARTSAAWEHREIASNHMVPNNRPRELADALLELA